VLNSYERFALPALTPVLHNLAVIAAGTVAAPLLDVPVKALAWGVFAAGAIQFGVQWLALARMGLLPKFRLDLAHPGVQRVSS
jgi:putative peptidoglycan lipid II flippase